jgi:excinuclease ABC subunit C
MPAPRGWHKRLEAKLQLLPNRPGVYLLKDGKGKILYIGKAKRLPARVRAYFRASRSPEPRLQALTERVRDIDYLVTANETEALVLEANLIRSHAPRYNIELKDDKKYPFVKVTTPHPYPRVVITRQVLADGARYFGPYTRVKDLRRVLRSLRRLFPLRSCTDRRLKQGGRECLDYSIGYCLAPCTSRADPAAYRATVDALLRFLGGEGEDVAREWKSQMKALAGELRFEESARLRDDVRRLEGLSQIQQMTDPERPDLDAVGLGVRAGQAAARIFSHRAGRVVGTWRMLVGRAELASAAEIMEAVITRHYQARERIPPLVLCSDEPRNPALVAEWLSARAGRRVRLHRPVRGARARLVRAAAENAGLLAEETELLEQGRKRRSGTALFALQEALGLKTAPYTIEGYDISNVQGRMATGSLVLFRDGQPHKSGYRRFRIREVKGADDFAMLAEVLRRRLTRLRDSAGESPDLILVDGGKGQVSRAATVLKQEGFVRVPVVGLAKKKEEIFRPGQPDPLHLPRSSPALQLLQRVRDEAHRFAVTYHRKLRSRALQGSARGQPAALFGPGIGPRTADALLAHFKTLAALRRASVEKMMEVHGIGPRLARRVFKVLHGSGVGAEMIATDKAYRNVADESQ